jgi:hypothetical protein
MRPVAAAAGFVPAAGGAGGCTILGCVTGGRFAGASGRAGCGILPGSSIRRRIVGGTNRPVGGSGAVGDVAATGSGDSSIVSSTTGGSSTGGASGTITTGGASSISTGGGGSISTTGGGATTAAGTSTGSSTGGGGAAMGAATSAGACGLTVLIRRGGPRTGAAGFGGSAFFGAGAFFAVVLDGTTCSANMSPPGSEMLRCRARRSTNERATTSSIVLEALFSSIP